MTFKLSITNADHPNAVNLLALVVWFGLLFAAAAASLIALKNGHVALFLSAIGFIVLLPPLAFALRSTDDAACDAAPHCDAAQENLLINGDIESLRKMLAEGHDRIDLHFS